MRILLATVAAIVLAAPPRGLEAQQPASGDPLLGQRIVDGVASRSTLWLRNSGGAVVAFDRATGARTVVATSGIADLVRVGGVTAGLAAQTAEPGAAAVVDLAANRPLTPRVEATDGILLRAGADWVVVGEQAIWRSDGGPWRRQGLEKAVATHRATIAATSDGSLYFGINNGEFGGGLRRLAPGAAAPSEIKRIDGAGLCNGPLNTACDPVTGVIQDPARPDCVLAAVGLAHGGNSTGRVLRVCGESVEVVFSKKVEGDPRSFAVFAGATVPLFGLVASAGGWTAVSYDKLITWKDGAATVVDMPKLAPWAGLMLAQTEGLVLTLTDYNWALSTSGYTPLIIPVTK